MGIMLNFRIPLVEGIAKETIIALAQNWIGTSRWMPFEEAYYPVDESEGVLTAKHESAQANFYHNEYTNHALKKFFLAYRIDKTDIRNRWWRADTIYEEGPNGVYLYVQLSRSMYHAGEISDCAEGISIPGMVFQIYKKGLNAPDHGFATGYYQWISCISEEEKARIRQAFAARHRMELPFLYLYVPEETEVPLLEKKVLSYFNKIAHVYAARTEEEDALWRMLSDSSEVLSASEDTRSRHFLTCEGEGFRIEIHAPLIDYHECLQLSKQPTMEEIKHKIFMLYRLSSQVLPLYAPTWDTIQMMEKLGGDGNAPETLSYQIIMSEALAAHMQAARKEKHLTQAQLADMVGSTGLLISRLERMQTIKVKRSLINEIERVLELSPNELTKLAATEKPQRKEQTVPDNFEEFVAGLDEANVSDPQLKFMAAAGKAAADDSSYPAAPAGDGGEEEVIFGDAPEAMFCFKCGTRLKAGANFCHRCGIRIN